MSVTGLRYEVVGNKHAYHFEVYRRGQTIAVTLYGNTKEDLDDKFRDFVKDDTERNKQ